MAIIKKQSLKDIIIPVKQSIKPASIIDSASSVIINVVNTNDDRKKNEVAKNKRV